MPSGSRGPSAIAQVYQLVLGPSEVSAWHAHESVTDRLFATQGKVRVVLCDLRDGSPSRGLLNELILGPLRPTLVVLPPRIWHGVQNLSPEPSALINMPDRAYRYEDPDHWSLPLDTEVIPYRFPVPGA